MMDISKTLTSAKEDGISKLVLQIAHQCNLRCIYCISDAGRWGKEENLMDTNTANMIVEKFSHLYRKINQIYFFGGEPALNLKVIETVAKKCNELVNQGILKEIPRFSFSSNGTIASKEFVALINKYNINFNISIDGPPEIHDKLRVSRSGHGTYYQIIENIKKLKKLTNQPKILEITFTHDHLQSQWKLWDMIKFLHCESGINIFAVTPAINTSYAGNSLGMDPSKNKENTINQFLDAAKNTMNEIMTSNNPIILLQVIKILNYFSKKGFEYCPAGRNYFSISWNGDIYPCQNIPETKEQLISNVNSPTLWSDICNSNIVKQIINANINARNILADKWYARFCRICPADNMSETGTVVEYAPFRHELQSRIASVVINELTNIAKDKKLNDEFIKRYTKLINDLNYDDD